MHLTINLDGKYAIARIIIYLDLKFNVVLQKPYFFTEEYIIIVYNNNKKISKKKELISKYVIIKSRHKATKIKLYRS